MDNFSNDYLTLGLNLHQHICEHDIRTQGPLSILVIPIFYFNEHQNKLKKNHLTLLLSQS